MKRDLLSAGAPFIRLVTGIGACLLGLTSTEAALLVYDGFAVPGDYANGASINGQGGGTGWSGTWGGDVTNSMETQSGSIAPAGLVSTDGVLYRNVAVEGSTSLTLGRQYSTTFGGSSPSISEGWFSLAFRRETNRGFVINPFDTNGNSGAGQFFGLFAGNNADMVARIRWAQSTDIEVSATSFSLALNTNYFFIGQVQFNPDGVSDVFNVWVRTASTFSDPLGTPDLTVSFDTNHSFSFWSLGVTNPLNTPTTTFDEFRIGTSYGDVVPLVPEPNAAILLSGSLLVLAAVRRRWRCR